MKIRFLLLYLVINGLLFLQCSENDPNKVSENAVFDKLTNTLQVDYLNNPDTSLLQIIAFSNIRKSGYGILLNLDNFQSKSEIDTLKRKFQKLDINAIHSFDIAFNDSLETKLKVAMEGAQFIWLLDGKMNWKDQEFSSVLNNIRSSINNQTLIVTQLYQ